MGAVQVNSETLEIVCTGARELPPDWDEEMAGSLFEPFEVIGGTKVTTNRRGCGRSITVPAPRNGDPADLGCWDVKTNAAGQVIEEHMDIVCPHCSTRTFIVRGR